MGNFDGCHQGHQALFRAVKQYALEHDLTPTVVSFEPHSRYVLNQPGDPLLLTTTAEKRDFVNSLGLEFVLMPFSRDLAKLPYDAFVRQELIGKLHMKAMFFGHDHCFGAFGKGNFETITESFPELDTHRLSIVLHKGERVTSSSVREALLNGDVKKAQTYLAHPYRLPGTVVGGKRLGRTIGFPTANLMTEEFKFIPQRGVYVASATLADGRNFRAVVNIGIQPSVGNQPLAIEAHLLHFNEDIYGQYMTLDLLDYLRPEQKFPSLDDLVRQISLDAATAEAFNGTDAHWAD
ncbi:MAG: riboflavin biosynthesis protein RibF [Fibrobacteraceae bacterium]|nr:riboflavin biosynthesis protein RibF [Fibrobacteraceae bacterium]